MLTSGQETVPKINWKFNSIFRHLAVLYVACTSS
jgi:hypothetical protein